MKPRSIWLENSEMEPRLSLPVTVFVVKSVEKNESVAVIVLIRTTVLAGGVVRMVTKIQRQHRP